MEPVLIGIGVDNSAVTHRLISASGAFTVNLWDSENARPFVKFSKPAVDDGDTLNGWAVMQRPRAPRSSTMYSASRVMKFGV